MINVKIRRKTRSGKEDVVFLRELRVLRGVLFSEFIKSL